MFITAKSAILLKKILSRQNKLSSIHDIWSLLNNKQQKNICNYDNVKTSMIEEKYKSNKYDIFNIYKVFETFVFQFLG